MPANDFDTHPHGTDVGHSRLFQAGLGAAVTGALAFLRLRFAAWPFHPIGFLLCYSYPLAVSWFSIFLGWLAKTLIVRFGGAQLYRTARNFFLGLIVGEAAAAAFWAGFSFIRYSMGLTFFNIKLLPT
jgi:hypothetical protein